MMQEINGANDPRLALRLFIGLLQGIGLYLLTNAARHHAWPSTAPMLHATLLFCGALVPILFLQGLGNIRWPRLLAWCAVATAFIAGLAMYEAWRNDGKLGASAIALWLFLSAGLFIAQALITGGDHDRRFMATYPTHFDVAWKLALQLILVFLFQLAFWALLWLGAFLFQLIGIRDLRDLITELWFIMAASSLMVAGGLHLTDVQPHLVRGMRTLVLALFSWLLPLLTVLAGGFLLALLSTGLTPLWHTKHASGELLSAAALLIILINAMYQDGRPERQSHPVLRYAGLAAAIILVPLVALAGSALAMRVSQYGWTINRVATAACVLVAGFYATGYALSVALPGPKLRFIERWNFTAALLILAVLLCLFSPIADPAAVAVNSQVARLASGAQNAATFDFNYLRSIGPRFGRDALTRLAQSANPKIRQGAQLALAGRFISPRPFGARASFPPKPETLTAMPVHPSGMSLPYSFVHQSWGAEDGDPAAGCQVPSRASCEAILTDLDGDGKDEVFVLRVMPSRPSPVGSPRDFFTARVFRQDANGHWRFAASLDYLHCAGDLDALRAGQIQTVPRNQPDILLQGREVRLNWIGARNQKCPG